MTVQHGGRRRLLRTAQIVRVVGLGFQHLERAQVGARIDAAEHHDDDVGDVGDAGRPDGLLEILGGDVAITLPGKRGSDTGNIAMFPVSPLPVSLASYSLSLIHI